MNLLAPLFLVGLLGLALPWLLHRFSLQNPPEQVFPSDRFLEATRPPVSRKRQLRHRLLFLLRTLFLAALCFLFAEPWLRGDATPDGVDRLHLIVIDRSFSMRTGERWSEALESLDELVASTPEGQALQLYSLDTQLTQLTEATLDGQQLRNVARSLTPAHGRNDYGDAMQRLNTVAGKADQPVRISLITDTQSSSLPGRLSELVASRVTELAVISVGSGDDTNVGITASARTVDGVHARLAINVSASQGRALADAAEVLDTTPLRRELVVRRGESVVARESLDLVLGENRTIVLDQIPLGSARQPELTVALLEPDALSDDNQQRVVVRGSDPLRVVLANVSAAASESARVFVKTALETDGIARVVTAPGNDSELPADAQHVVAFVDVSSGLPADVVSFVENGGNALLVNTPADAIRNASSHAAVSLSRPDAAHPLALGDINWFDVAYYDVPTVETQTDDAVLLASADNQPVLIQRQSGEGTLLILNDRLDGVQSDLPLQPAFVRLMQNTLAYFEANAAIPERLYAGELLSLPANTQLLSPDGDTMLELAATGNAQQMRLSEPGVYTVLGKQGSHALAVTIDPLESVITTMSESDVTSWQGKHSALSAPDDSVDLDNNIERTTPELPDGRLPLWPWLLSLLAVLFLSESLFANRRLGVRRDGS